MFRSSLRVFIKHMNTNLKHKIICMLNIFICGLWNFAVLFSVFVWLGGKCMFSCIGHKLKGLCKTGCIRKAVPLVKIFNVPDVHSCGRTWLSWNIICLMRWLCWLYNSNTKYVSCAHSTYFFVYVFCTFLWRRQMYMNFISLRLRCLARVLITAGAESLHGVQTSFEDHPAFCLMGTGVLSRR
jgi:hypothetical protein